MNRFIDHTLLKPEATPQEVIKLCEEAKNYAFAAVCVNSCYIELAARHLQGSGVEICSVVGFPLGSCTSKTKAFETREAIDDGATEIDMVINVGQLKAQAYDYVEWDIRRVVETAGSQVPVKVIIEACLLTDEEKIKACLLAKNAGAAFVKTSTGFSKSGATTGDVALMRKVVGSEMGVKAAGGIRDFESASKMVTAGASRIGASASVKIVS
ncbi:deoxyribose-phosphate aldolase [candidate division KSB1 bacterium]|nr:deoxyribose-phosphate aldolase [candidate division KSB1 bacterium]